MRKAICVVGFVLLCLPWTVLGQSGFGSIAGKVADPSGAVIAGAKVVATNVATNAKVEHPTNAVAKQIYLDTHNEKETAVISQFFKTRGLFFFYSSTCPYCQKFAPIVKSFAARHGILVIPITTDGIPLPDFPNSRTDIGQARKFKIRITPALFAVNPYNNKALPIAYGFISESDLRQRILDIATDFKNNL